MVEFSITQSDSEWQIVDMACHSYDKVSVALYDTLGPTSVGERELRYLTIR